MLLRISLFAALLLSCFCFTSALLMSVNKPRTMKASWKALKMSTVEEDDDFEGSGKLIFSYI